ncbi:hypothetical protein D3C83_11220 [compost metagenome]
MLRRRPPRRAHRRAEDERHLPLAARHVVDLRRLVADLIHDQHQEVAEHDVDDRPHAGHRGADAQAGEARLRDRRIDDPPGAEFLDQALEHLEGRARFGDVLAHEDDGRVAAHLFGNRLADGVAETDLLGGVPDGRRRRCFRHRCPQSPCSDPDTARPPRTPPRRPSGGPAPPGWRRAPRDRQRRRPSAIRRAARSGPSC